MLEIIQIFSEISSTQKEELIALGLLSKLMTEVEASCCQQSGMSARTTSTTSNTETRRARWTRRPSTASSQVSKGIGYGSGSTKSKWDIERAVEERIAQEEHLMWLICALTTFLCGDSLKLSDANPDLKKPKEQPAIPSELIENLVDSSLLNLLEYNFNNDSIFDISQRMDLYQALIELTAALSYVPEFLPNLVHPRNSDSKSIAKEILPRFRATLNQYPRSIRGQSSPDFIFMDFIRRVNDLSDIIGKLARRYEQSLPPEKRVKTAVITNRRQMQVLEPRPISVSMERLCTSAQSLDNVYAQIMQNYQIQTHRLLNDAGKPLYGFTFKKELRNVNPFSPSLKDRTKRIAKELASLHTSLPLNASNSIFVCMDETRCDMLKVLISGPEGTPYENGLFEFDVFFPSNYPLSAPKCAFLTTGGGTIRFNPNLYSDGKICLSILGTWEGRPEEKWNVFCSLLQVLISIQGLIFVKESYFNEPGFEKFQETEKGREYSNRYNLHISQATLQFAIHEQFNHPSVYFKDVIKRHFWLKRHAVIEQAERWLKEIQTDMQPGVIENDGDSAVSESSSYMNPTAQRQNVQKLINEFKNMQNPLLNSTEPGPQ